MTTTVGAYLRTTYVLLLTNLALLGLGTVTVKDNDSFQVYNSIRYLVKVFKHLVHEPIDSSGAYAYDQTDSNDQEVKETDSNRDAAPDQPTLRQTGNDAPTPGGSIPIDEYFP